MAQLGRGQPQPAVISRGSLADPPDLLKRGPLVISGARDRLAFAVTAGQGTPVPAVISRNSLADAPVLTTPAVLAAPQPQAAAPAAAAPAAVVIAAQPPRPAGAQVTARSSLQDFATPATPPPAVIPAAATPRWGQPGPAVIAAAPAITAAPPAQAAPA